MNNKSLWIFLITIQVCPISHSVGQRSFDLKLKRKKISNFQQALAHLYAQKPHLLQPQQPIETVITNSPPYSWKKILAHSVDLVPLLYFCYGTYGNYTNHTEAHQHFQESYLHQTILSNFPSLFVNTPRHVGFFLQETELLLQAYLLKLLLKMIVFCFG